MEAKRVLIVEPDNAFALSLAAIFREEGEEAFRALEREEARELSQLSRRVIAAGGGAFARTEVRDLLRDGAVSVWLRGDLDVLLARLPARVDAAVDRGAEHDGGPVSYVFDQRVRGDPLGVDRARPCRGRPRELRARLANVRIRSFSATVRSSDTIFELFAGSSNRVVMNFVAKYSRHVLTLISRSMPAPSKALIVASSR